MYIAMNRFRIAPGREEDFLEGWRNRDSHLEEVPGDGALAELPASMMREMSEAMKIEMKIEQMMNGK